VFVSSRDGFCSVIQFDEGELGKQTPPPESLLLAQQQQQQQRKQVETAPEPSQTAGAGDQQKPGGAGDQGLALNDKIVVIGEITSSPSNVSPLKRPAPAETVTAEGSAPTQPEPNKKRRIAPQLISAVTQNQS